MSFSAIRPTTTLGGGVAGNKIGTNVFTTPPPASTLLVHQASFSDHNSESTLESLVDYHNTDYRGFLFVVHEKHGLLLLHCTRKKSKPPHFQLPGGHVDDHEFVTAAQQSADRREILQLAGKMGAVRELFEETGLDFRGRLGEVKPAKLRKVDEDDDDRHLENEYLERLFYVVNVRDIDFTDGQVSPMDPKGTNIKLALSVEHSGYTFEADPKKASEMLHLHSGGKCASALIMSMDKASDGHFVDLLPPKTKSSWTCCLPGFCPRK